MVLTSFGRSSWKIQYESLIAVNSLEDFREGDVILEADAEISIHVETKMKVEDHKYCIKRTAGNTTTVDEEMTIDGKEMEKTHLPV